MKRFTCVHCKGVFTKNVRIKEDSERPQRYCSSAACQKARKNLWARKKYKRDSCYMKKIKEKNHRRYSLSENSVYQKAYRESHPEYVERCRISQQKRNKKRVGKKEEQKIVNPDALALQKIDNKEVKRDYFILYPITEEQLKKIVNPDALLTEVVDIQQFTNAKPEICLRM